MARIYLYPPLRRQEDVNTVLSRLAWYFRPYMERIEAIHFTGSRATVDAVRRAPHLDPAVSAGLADVKRRCRLLSPADFDARMEAIAPEGEDILLIWDERAEKGASTAVKAAIRALSPKRGVYRVDPHRTRMEGSFYLWAGINRWLDAAALAEENHARMRAMIADLGRHEKAYVFGTGPSLSEFVEGHDFSDGITIIANSIVKNREMVARLKPKVIAAADPLYHAGCSDYAGAFRTELIGALEETGAWFVCPLRDVAFYRAVLPEALQPRIIGIPFDKEAPPPLDLGETFHLKPYPNVLTLALLPLAATLARQISVVGCDGRRLTDDSFFWSHDRKVQFNDKMSVIQAAHPAFFAIDYNDYYTEHCRDLETVLVALEEAGRSVTSATPSLIPALARRTQTPPPALPEIRTIAMIDPDAKGDWGHFLAYDKRLAEGAAERGLATAVLCRKDLEVRFKPEKVDALIPAFSVHSWSIGNRKFGSDIRKDAMTFARELEAGLDALEARYPEGGICVFMYVGSLEVAELLEYLLVDRPRLRAVVNLFWSYNFDQEDPAYRARWHGAMARLVRSPQIRLTHSTGQIAAEFRQGWGIDVPVLPHPSTTFGDAEAARRAAALSAGPQAGPPAGPPAAPQAGPQAGGEGAFRAVFPGGTRKEKGFLLSVGACAALAGDPAIRPVLRARLDQVSGDELKQAFARLDRSAIEVLDGDLSDAEFVAMIGTADLVVIPYHAEAFRRRTSGILVDAVLLGRPVVVLEETWLADIVAREGIGLVAPPTVAGVVAAVRRAAAAPGAFSAGIVAAARAYLAEHSWARLVDRVTALAAGPAPAARPALSAISSAAPPAGSPEPGPAAAPVPAPSPALAAPAPQPAPSPALSPAPQAGSEPAPERAPKPAPNPAPKPASEPAPKRAPGGPREAALRTKLKALVAAVPTKSPIYLPTEKISLENQVAGMERVKRLYDEELETLYRPRLRALREAYRGRRRCFVIGNGPSLNRTDLSLLKDEVTFAVNGFFLKAGELDWSPTFYCVEDHLVAEDRVKWVNALKGPIKLFPAYLRYVFPQGEDTIFFNHRPRKSYPHGFDFSTDAAEVTYTGCTVTFTVLQLAFYLGFREIHLIGVDADYAIPTDAEQASDYSVGVIDMKSDDPNHFHPDYFGKGFRWHDPQVDKMVEAYREARRVVDASGQRITNATVGGKLEVFERRDYAALFPAPARPKEAWPKTLVIDMTATGNGTATGEVKANLFAGWPKDRLLQLADDHPGGLSLVRPTGSGTGTGVTDGRFAVEGTTPEAARAAIEAFAPEAILYRPVPAVPHLHDLAMETIGARAQTPLVTWVMDDWPTRLAAENPQDFARLGPDLERLLARSAVRLSISEAMSEALEARYGVPFAPLANGVEAADWPTARIHRAGPVLVRYAGGLAPNMGQGAVLRVARAVEALAAEGLDIRLEIRTRKVQAHTRPFERFERTAIFTETMPAAAYRGWLAGADIVLIAYNFDEATLRYVRYSMANKMPECLASGAAVFAHGPQTVATIDYLARSGVAEVVAREKQTLVHEALGALARSPARRNALAQAARIRAFSQHNLGHLREALRRHMAEAAPRPESAPLVPAWREGSDLLEALAGRLVAGGMPDPRLARLFAATLANAALLEPEQALARTAPGTPVGRALARILEETPPPNAGHLRAALEHARAGAGSAA